MADDELTPEEQVELDKLMKGNAPVADEKHNVHTFISRVLTAKDTTKVGNLKEEEIGMLGQHVRGYKEEESWARNIIKCEGLAEMFAQQSEIATSTSLSRDATLLKVATTTTRQLGDVTRPQQQNKGWFKSKRSNTVGGQPQVL